MRSRAPASRATSSSPPPATSGMDTDFDPMYPAAYDLDNIISVAATDHNDQLAWFSNYGATSVDLGAPGRGCLQHLPQLHDGSHV